MLKAVAMKFPASYTQPHATVRLLPNLIFSFASALRSILTLQKYSVNTNTNKNQISLIVVHWRRYLHILTLLLFDK